MTPDELKSMPKGTFITMHTVMHPMKTTFRLFLDWGITFGKPFTLPKNAARKVQYAGWEELLQAIQRACQLEQEVPERQEPDSSIRKVIPRTD